jgi:hypothetical protein
MKRLSVIFAVCAIVLICTITTASAWMSLPSMDGGATGGGAGCSGTYGPTTANASYTNDAAAKTIITKVVIDCTGSPTIGTYAYSIHLAERQAIFVIYDDDSGPNDLVCQTNASQDDTLGPGAHTSSDWASACNLSAGTYYIGAQLAHETSRIYKSDTGEGESYISAAGTFGTPDSAWNGATDSESSNNYVFNLQF